MKQLLIVNSQKALNAKADNSGANVTPYDFSNLAEGAVSFFELDAATVLSAAATKNFGIALGRGVNKPAFIIPEVDIDTLEIVKALPTPGTKFTVTIPLGTTVVGKEYTIILCKKGTVANERSVYSTSIVAKTTNGSSAYAESVAMVNAINNKANELFNVTASYSTTNVTIAANDYTDYEVVLADALTGVSPSSTTHAKKAIGDKAYIADLAQRCAADKGFVYLDGESKDIYPGYPEAVEDLVPNASGSDGVSTAGYAIYNLHFATGRKSGKQLDERVWQYVHIAVPITNSSYSTIDSILPEGKFSANAMAASASAAVTAAAASSGTGTGG